ncbi:phosphate ABC transporter periplasmic binding protein [Rhodovastum atsumiense]|uniref:Phosphate-binding protein PstS n=1 Tax=Rhodovastum atsumiense TaxID=504468 RepID=A0A5M6IJU7_9PROT|nr:phosphate ABC transporter substrate-binding protein PstS [Rhodovastum atsumiense]KAA5608544.1 phosphate ABC transporter substrate-binding protein PstS [Rhodovastum atsumiense]CAH2599984.1 phosphate ABC transporter periplasmic binding protein [Rhodovastum atsumiense]
MKLVSTTLAIAMAGFTFAAQAQQITGAGATFPAPVYAKWGEAAKQATGLELNYQAIGSGGGQNQIINRTVDFGASDAPVDTARLESNRLLQFPTVMGAVVPIVNLPGIEPNKLKLTGELLTEIYLGKITKWNDPKLAELNRDLKLPNLAIAPVYRADGSGTTFVFTSYLSAVSPDWKSQVGASTSVKWVVGNGAKGNDGVAATVKQVRGGIGYVENAYATQNKLTTTQLRNKAGQFVEPTLPAFTAAAEAGDWRAAPNYAVNLIDTAGAKAWPIVSATFILLPKDPKDATRSANVIKFFDYAYRNGDQIAQGLEYIPLPGAVKDSVRASWRTEIRGADGAPVYK